MRARLPIAAVAAALLLAGCGSSSTSTTTTRTAAGSSGRRATFEACLRKHGVTLPPRPRSFSPGGPPSGGGRPKGVRPDPKLRAALQACGANFGFRRLRFGRQKIERYVACVRGHGYQLPSPNLSGDGPVFPARIRSNPKFRAASRVCQGLLVPPRGGSPA